MKLINTRNGKMEEFFGSNIPKYAILSHTWEEEEVTFSDMMTNPNYKAKKGYGKIEMTCRLAASDGLDYAWIDTCCIDKSSSAELSEAINSMYRWYERSVICYGYLSDLEPSTPVDVGFPGCRWVTRGWTLQELIAPERFYFFDKEWNCRGSKTSLEELVSKITGIQTGILNKKESLSSVPVGRRMAWAARRQTTRIEDRAYSLLGIFDVNMPMLYGEEEKAFQRLQEEIIKQSVDLSIFAWKLPPSTRPPTSEEMVCGLLAKSPDHFEGCSSLQSLSSVASGSELSISNKRVKTNAIICAEGLEFIHQRPYLVLECFKNPGTGLGVQLIPCGPNEFARHNPWDLFEYPKNGAVKKLWDSQSTKKYLLTDLDEESRAEKSVYGGFLMQPFLRDRRSCVLHIKTPPEVSLDYIWPEGSCDPVDQLSYSSANPTRDFVFALLTFNGSNLGLRDPRNPLYSLRGVTFRYMLMVANWNSLESNVQDRIRFSIHDVNNDREASAMDMYEYVYDRGANLGNTFTGDWLNRRNLLRASSVATRVPGHPTLGIKLSVTPRVVMDSELSKHHLLRLEISYESGRMDALSRGSIPKPILWDLRN